MYRLMTALGFLLLAGPAFAGGKIKSVTTDKAKVTSGQEVNVSIKADLSKSDPGCALKVVLTHGDASTEEVLSMGVNNFPFEMAVKTKVPGDMTITVSGVKKNGVPKCKKQAKAVVAVVKANTPVKLGGLGKAQPKFNPGNLTVGDGNEDPGTEGGVLKGITAEHNKLRAALNKGIPNLTWDPAIAKFAEARAKEQAKTCTLKHTNSQYGENLAGGNSSVNNAKAIVGMWAEEKADYDHTAKKCKTGDAMDCGHYTQVIWKKTTKLGCGYAACSSQPWGAGSAIWVCNYSPPGNYSGQAPY